MTNYAIIGADSMLAKELARQLISRGDNVITVGRKFHNNIVFDLETGIRQESVDKKIHADVAFHCAAAFFDNDTYGLQKNLTVNIIGSLKLLDLLERLKCNCCYYAGSVSSYGNFDSGSLNSYGMSKECAEKIISWGLTKINGKFCSLRFSQIYDTEGLCCHHQPWFGRIIAYASRGLDLRLPPSNAVRNYLHVSDAARFMIKAADSQITGTWPVCSKESFNHFEIASAAYQEFENGGKVIVDKSKTPFREVNFPLNYKIYEKLNEFPYVDLKSGLKMIHNSNTAVNFGPLDVL